MNILKTQSVNTWTEVEPNQVSVDKTLVRRFWRSPPLGSHAPRPLSFDRRHLEHKLRMQIKSIQDLTFFDPLPPLVGLYPNETIDVWLKTRAIFATGRNGTNLNVQYKGFVNKTTSAATVNYALREHCNTGRLWSTGCEPFALIKCVSSSNAPSVCPTLSPSGAPPEARQGQCWVEGMRRGRDLVREGKAQG